jgi:hypothetical protein
MFAGLIFPEVPQHRVLPPQSSITAAIPLDVVAELDLTHSQLVLAESHVTHPEERIDTRSSNMTAPVNGFASLYQFEVFNIAL